MKIGFYKNVIRPNEDELRIYKEILDFNDIDYIDLDTRNPSFWSELGSIDLFVFKWGHDHHSTQVAAAILPVIERYMNVKCFPNHDTGWHYDDKIKQFFLLSQAGFPAVDSFVFWDKRVALQWLEGWKEFPLVFKLKSGAGSDSVKLVNTRRRASRLVKRLFGPGISQNAFNPWQTFKVKNHSFLHLARFYGVQLRDRFFTPERKAYWFRHKNYAYFQRFMPGNDFDTRVTTAGDKVHAFRRFNRPNDFRASGSDLWDIDPEKIDKRMLRIALDISRHFGFQGMAYDFVYDENREPRIIEMSYLYGGAGYPDFMNGYWDKDLNWAEGRYWPQYFELVEILGRSDLGMPDMEARNVYQKKAKIAVF